MVFIPQEVSHGQSQLRQYQTGAPSASNTAARRCPGTGRHRFLGSSPQPLVTKSPFLNHVWALRRLIFKTSPQALPSALFVASPTTPSSTAAGKKNPFLLKLLYRFYTVFDLSCEPFCRRAAIFTLPKR